MDLVLNPIVCFQHCKTGTYICCLDLPRSCPVCLGDLTGDSLIPPFRLPGPLVYSLDYPYSVVIKQTRGNFLDDYQKESNLHIGLTDSYGSVYDFDSQGISFSRNGWNACIVVYTLDRYDYQRQSCWDSKLYEYSKNEMWSSERYSEEQQNCYSFVLGFLQCIRLDTILPIVRSQSDFSHDFVIKQTTKLAKYISMYRRLVREGFLIQSSPTVDALG